MTESLWNQEKDAELGARIRIAREAKGYSLHQFSLKIGVSKGTCGHWETGARTIKHHDLAAICHVLSISADELLFGTKRWPFEGIEFSSIQNLEVSELNKLEGALISTANQYGLDVKVVKKSAANAGNVGKTGTYD